MSDRVPQSALREWRREMRQPPTLIALTGVGIVLGISGPFGTIDLLPIAARLIYWLVVAFTTYAAGLLVNLVLVPRLRGRGWHVTVMVLALSLGTTCAVTCVLLAINGLAFQALPDWDELPGFLGALFAISLVINGALTYLEHHRAQNRPAPKATPPQSAPPPLLDRLDLDKRGALVALGVEDHYVRVRTVNGESLILMRLSDAIREVGDTPGAQVHRSYWAAFDQATAVQRIGDRATLTMTTGPDIPVSRANLVKLKEAGLLPR